MATLQNIGKLKYRGKDGQWHPLPVVVQDANGGVSTISGKGAPTSATQGKVNQLYRDEDTQRLYICTATDGGYTWAAVSGGSVDVDATLTKAGYAADAKAAGDAIGGKIDKAQGVENAGMILGVDEDGNVVPGDPSYLPGFVSYTRVQGMTYDQQALAKANIGAGTLRDVYYWRANGTPEDPNGVMTCAIHGDTCICGGTGDSLPDGMKAPVLVIYGSIDGGYRDATAFDGSNATWTFTVNLRDYSYSTPIKKSGVPAPATAQVGQIVKVKSVDESGKITETEAVDMPSGGSYTLPIASSTVLGGVKPIAKTDAMTQNVGVDEAGALWTAAGGGSGETWEKIKEISVEEEVNSLTVNSDISGNAFAVKKIKILFYGTSTQGYDIFLNGTRYFRYRMLAATASFGSLVVEPFIGKMLCYGCGSIAENWHVNAAQMAVFSNAITVNEIKIIPQNSGTVDAGNKITIEGVRA